LDDVFDERDAMSEQDDLTGEDTTDRRRFIKRVAITSAFAVPVVTSFSMTGLSLNSASAAPASNQSIAPA
jgi:hypothetical protein